MSWRDILGVEKRGNETLEKHTQNPQNPLREGNFGGFEDIEDIEERKTQPDSSPASEPITHWPEGTALVVHPGWWPGPPFYVVRSEEERAALIEEGEYPGHIWTLAEARKLAGLKPGEKLDVARAKAMFGGEVSKVRDIQND